MKGNVGNIFQNQNKITSYITSESSYKSVFFTLKHWYFFLLSVVCKGTTFDIICPTNSSITISEANYGRTDTYTCARFLGLESLCRNYEITEEILISHCDNKTTCTIPVENDFFGNPCFGISKYLNVTYYCKGKKNEVLNRNVKSSFSWS